MEDKKENNKDSEDKFYADFKGNIEDWRMLKKNGEYKEAMVKLTSALAGVILKECRDNFDTMVVCTMIKESMNEFIRRIDTDNISCTCSHNKTMRGNMPKGVRDIRDGLDGLNMIEADSNDMQDLVSLLKSIKARNEKKNRK